MRSLLFSIIFVLVITLAACTKEPAVEVTQACNADSPITIINEKNDAGIRAITMRAGEQRTVRICTYNAGRPITTRPSVEQCVSAEGTIINGGQLVTVAAAEQLVGTEARVAYEAVLRTATTAAPGTYVCTIIAKTEQGQIGPEQVAITIE